MKLSRKAIAILVRESVPTCGVIKDGCSDRYRVWLSEHGPVIFGRTKAELKQNILSLMKTPPNLTLCEVFNLTHTPMKTHTHDKATEQWQWWHNGIGIGIGPDGKHPVAKVFNGENSQVIAANIVRDHNEHAALLAVAEAARKLINAPTETITTSEHHPLIHPIRSALMALAPTTKGAEVKTQSFSAMWTDKLGEAISKASTETYPMEFHYGTEDIKSFVRAVNQGIDSRLEAISFIQSKGSNGRFRFEIEAKSVPILVRRLLDSEHENDNILASSICETLNIELI